MSVLDLGGERVLVYDGPPIADERAAGDAVGDALGEGATILALPVDRLDPSFFRLSSGLAGAIAQKAVNYRRRLAVVGDVSAQVAGSDALRDWVRECNRGREVWFVDSLDALAERLGARR